MKHTRLIAMLLLASTCATFAACAADATDDSVDTTSASQSNGETAVAETTATSDAPDLPDVDMDGFTLRVSNVTQESLAWATVGFHYEEANGDMLNDALYNRDAALIEKYNYKIEQTLHSYADESPIIASVLADDDMFDLSLVYDTQTQNVIPYAASWSDVPHIQLDKVWWNPSATGLFNIGGETYATAGDYTLGYKSRAMCYFFNKNIYDTLGLDKTPYDYVNENQWTTEQFVELAAVATKDVNGDGEVKGDDQVGIFGNPRGIFNTMLGGTGVQFVTQDSDGKFVFDLHNDERAIGIIEKIIGWYKLGLDYNTGNAVHVTEPGSLFTDGQALFYVQGMPYFVEQFRSMDDEFGIVPVPKYDESQENYYSMSYGAVLGFIPKTAPSERFENFGIIMEAMTYETYKNIVPVYMEVITKTKYARDEESLPMLDIVFNSIAFDPGTLIWCGKITDKICQNVFMTKSDAVVSFLEANAEVYQGEIDKFNEAIEG